MHDLWTYPVVARQRHINHPFAEWRGPSFPGNHKHEGIDLLALLGDEIVAVEEGALVHVHDMKNGRAYGNHLIVKHEDGTETLYAHLDEFADGMSVGVNIAQGQLLGIAGSTGNSTGPHLHLTWAGRGGMNGFCYPNVLNPTEKVLTALLVDRPKPPHAVPVSNQLVINLLYKAIAPLFQMHGDQLVRLLQWQDVYEDRKGPFNWKKLIQRPPGVRDDVWLKVAELVSRLGESRS